MADSLNLKNGAAAEELANERCGPWILDMPAASRDSKGSHCRTNDTQKQASRSPPLGAGDDGCRYRARCSEVSPCKDTAVPDQATHVFTKDGVGGSCTATGPQPELSQEILCRRRLALFVEEPMHEAPFSGQLLGPGGFASSTSSSSRDGDGGPQFGIAYPSISGTSNLTVALHMMSIGR